MSDPRAMRRAAARRRNRRWGAVAAAALLPLLTGGTGSEPAAAKTFTVKSTRDDGRGSLRALIVRANRRDGDDRIRIPSRLRGDLRVGSNLRVRDTLTIEGHAGSPAIAARPPRRAGSEYPVILIDDFDARRNPKVTIRRIELDSLGIETDSPLAVQHARLTSHRDEPPELAISSYDTKLRVQDSTISGWDTGIWWGYDTDARVDETTITGNGVGIRTEYGYGEVTDSRIAENDTGVSLRAAGLTEIENSFIADNSGGGGLVVSYGARGAILNSTITGNEAPRGGGVSLLDTAELTIDNSTISGNSAVGGPQQLARGGGIFTDYHDSLELAATTVTGNSAFEGGGIFLGRPRCCSSRSTVTSSIVAGNVATGSGADCLSAPPGLPVSGGGNVLGQDGCGTEASDDVTTADPRLGPLEDNGGPTPTHALLASSPAIGHGRPLHFIVTDQRGVERDANPDSGSYELRETAP